MLIKCGHSISRIKGISKGIKHGQHISMGTSIWVLRDVPLYMCLAG